MIGILSGTSADSVDAALCRIQGSGAFSANMRVTLEEFVSQPYPLEVSEKLRNNILELTSRDVATLNVEIGDAFADTCRILAKKSKIELSTVDLIGSHGQTIFHHSGLALNKKCSLQIGDGDRIALSTGVAVFCDFRAKDIAAGGEGAPLTPYTDAALFSRYIKPGCKMAVLNLGGISNLTILGNNFDQIIGFDSGPANAPLDRIARILTKGGKDYDDQGQLAAAGSINFELLEKLCKEDTFIKRKPPKSAGFEIYGDQFVERALELHGKADHDLIATVTEFVAVSVQDALQNLIQPTKVDELIVAGGGSQNKFLIDRISERLRPIPVRLSDELGVPYKAREAMAFAILANDALFGHETSIPGVTGAKKAVMLGKLCLP